MRIPVIIPFYRKTQQLEKCLCHLRSQSMPVEVFIRDNNEDNIFFTAAVNEGILHFLDKPADYLIVLNQDMYLGRDAVQKMVTFLESHPRCGIGAPLQIHCTDPTRVIWGGSYEAFPVGRHQHGHIDQFKKDAKIYWANGACLILRKRMVQEIGLLDKNLRFIGSDSDYSLTARTRGWEIWRIAAARGVHEHGASGNSGNPGLELLKVRDMLYFADKWLSGNLYRQLAYEGATLSPGCVQETIAALRLAEKKLSAQNV